MGQPRYTVRQIADAIAQSSGKARHGGDTVFQRVKASAQTGVLLGEKRLGAGRTSARLYPIEEAAFAAILDTLRDFGIGGNHAKELRIGFFAPEISQILAKIRKGEEFALTLDFSLRSQGASLRCALHPLGCEPDWSLYEHPLGAVPVFGEPHEALFSAEWPIKGTLRPFLFALEPDNDDA